VTKTGSEDINEPLLTHRDIKTIGMVIVTSDKGLCGSYNSNLIRFANAEIKKFQEKGFKVKIWLVGNKSFGAYKYTNHQIIDKYSGLPQFPTYIEARMIKDSIIANFLDMNVDKVVFAYTRFISMMTYKPTLMELLPVAMPETTSDSMAQYVFEPDAATMVSQILPQYVENQILRALLESSASELAARMTAMSSASKNAKEMIDSLTLVYNKARQAAITKEILEVVGGAEALEK
jgi:F-type H+-transporting ATPase subunit gamma